LSHLLKENRFLKEENERLRKESANYLAKWVAAQDRSYTRMIKAALELRIEE